MAVDVPQAPGVPPLLNQIAGVQNTVVLLVADALEVVGLFQAPQWGLFTQGGQPAFSQAGTGIVAEVLSALGPGGQSVGGVEHRWDYRIATAPQEQGAFLSYNKVATPWEGRVTYIIGGTAAQRGTFLQSVDAAAATLTPFNLVMPEYAYANCNVVHRDFRRTARNGITMFAVDIWVEQVRVTGTAAFTQTKTAAGANQVNGGTVQPAQPTTQLQTAVTSGVS
jgi:hypothetical protein